MRNPDWRICLVLVWSVEVWADITHPCLHSSLSISCFMGSQLHSSFHEKKTRTNCSCSWTRNFASLWSQTGPQKVSSFKLIWDKPRVCGQVKRLNSNSDLCFCEEDWPCYIELCPGQTSDWLLESLWVSESIGWGPELRRNKPNHCWKVWWLHTDLNSGEKSTLQCLDLCTDNLSVQVSVFSSKTQQKGLIVLKTKILLPTPL